MDAVVAFIANGEATKPVEPGERALDDPAAHAKAAAVGRAATAEDRNNAAGGEATLTENVVSPFQAEPTQNHADEKSNTERNARHNAEANIFSSFHRCVSFLSFTDVY